MRIHAIRNAPFEGPARIAEWAAERGHTLTESLAPTGEYPPAHDVGLLVIMGGPMDADDHEASPWLPAEKDFVRQVRAAGGRILGVCLGAQILAEVAGGAVRRNPVREIGWYPVRITEAGRREPVFSAMGEGLTVGHWHGDTFELPEGVSPALSSDACVNQAFVTDAGRSVGLQFHLEWTEESLAALVRECAGDLAAGGEYVATADELLAGARANAGATKVALWGILDEMCG